MQELIVKFDTIYNNYLLTPDIFNIQMIRPNPYIADTQFITSGNPPEPNIINNILTNAVTNEFLKNNDTILEIINLYITIYEYAINRYIQTHPELGVNNNNIKFTLKGGLSFLLIISRLIYEMPENIADNFIRLFVTNIFNKSDIDFSIIVDYNTIPVNNRIIVFNDLYNRGVYLLVYVLFNYSQRYIEKHFKSKYIFIFKIKIYNLPVQQDGYVIGCSRKT